MEKEIYWIDVIKIDRGARKDIPPLLEIRDETVPRSEKCLNPDVDM